MNAVEIKKVIQDINDFRISHKNSFIDFSNNKENILYKIAIKSVGAKGYTPFIEELGMVLLDDAISFTKGKLQPRKIDSIDSIKIAYFSQREKRVLKEIIYSTKQNNKKILEKHVVEKTQIKKEPQIKQAEKISSNRVEDNNSKVTQVVKEEKSKWVNKFKSIIEEIKDNFFIAKIYFRNGDYCYINLYNLMDFNNDFDVRRIEKTIINYKDDYIVICNVYDKILEQTHTDFIKKKIFIMENEVTRIEGEISHKSECCNSKKICSELCYNIIREEEMNKTM